MLNLTVESVAEFTGHIVSTKQNMKPFISMFPSSVLTKPDHDFFFKAMKIQ